MPLERAAISLKIHQQADFERIIEVFKAHDIGYFFYNGGNDSMDTANKVAQLAQERGLDLVATGVPKTIDNDVGDAAFQLIDHTPGYGSVARYWALNVQNANEENAGSSPSDPVLVLQAMGRKIGFIPAAARLADPNREMPLLILMRESGMNLEDLADAVNTTLKQHQRALVVVSEGFDVGDIGERKDSFGHTMFSSSEMTVEQIVVNYLNKVGLAARGSARGNVPGTDQRHNVIYASHCGYRGGIPGWLESGANRSRIGLWLYGNPAARIRVRFIRSGMTKFPWIWWQTPSVLFRKRGSQHRERTLPMILSAMPAL